MTNPAQPRNDRLREINTRIRRLEKAHATAANETCATYESIRDAKAERDALIAVSVEYPDPVQLEDK